LTEVEKEGKKDEEYERAMKQEATPEELAPKDRKAREIKKENGVLYRGNLLWVPKGLIQPVLESEHDTKIVGHM